MQIEMQSLLKIHTNDKSPHSQQTDKHHQHAFSSWLIRHNSIKQLPKFRFTATIFCSQKNPSRRQFHSVQAGTCHTTTVATKQAYCHYSQSPPFNYPWELGNCVSPIAKKKHPPSSQTRVSWQIENILSGSACLYHGTCNFPFFAYMYLISKFMVSSL